MLLKVPWNIYNSYVAKHWMDFDKTFIIPWAKIWCGSSRASSNMYFKFYTLHNTFVSNFGISRRESLYLTVSKILLDELNSFRNIYRSDIILFIWWGATNIKPTLCCDKTIQLFTRPVLNCLFFSSYSRETYNALTNWLTDARTLASPNIVIILCGNKKDLDADREVTFLEASRFAQENGEHSSICVVSHLTAHFLSRISCTHPCP